LHCLSNENIVREDVWILDKRQRKRGKKEGEKWGQPEKTGGNLGRKRGVSLKVARQ
jgi:hypothetical protein